MIVSLIAFVLITGTLGSTADLVPYTGYRMTIDKPFVLDMLTATIDGAVKEMPLATWPDLNITKSVSFFSFGFYVYEIKCTKASYDKKGAALTVANNKAEVKQSGAGIVVEYSFKWRFQLFGMDLLYGVATGTATSTQATFTETFINRDIISTTMVTWAFTYVLDWQNMFGVSKMLDYVFLNNAVPYMNLILNKPLSKKVLEGLRPWLDVMIPFHEDKSLIVWMMNSFYVVTESPVNYVTIAMATNLTGVDRPYNKRLFREVKTPVAMNQKKCQICMANPMTAGIMEIQNKGKDFLFPIDPVKDLKLTGTLMDLLPYMPKLAEQFDLNDALYIGCRPNGGFSIQMIKDAQVEDGNTMAQVVVSCDFGDKPQGKLLVTANMIVKAKLAMTYEAGAKAFVVKGTLVAPKLYNYDYSYAYVPIYYPDSLASLLVNIVRLADNFPLLQSGLSVLPPFQPKVFEKVIGKEEVCFNYA